MTKRNLYRTAIAASVSIGCTLAAWTFIPSATSTHADEKPTNLILNGHFTESEGEGDARMPKHWTKTEPIEGVEYIYHVDAPEGGNEGKFVEIKKTAVRYFPIAAWEQTFDYDGKSKAIRVTASVKAVDVTKAIIDVVFLDDNDAWLEHAWCQYIGNDDDSKRENFNWKEEGGAVPIPQICKKIRVSLQQYGPGRVMFDDVVAQYESELPKQTTYDPYANSYATKIPPAGAEFVPPPIAAIPAQSTQPAQYPNGSINVTTAGPNRLYGVPTYVRPDGFAIAPIPPATQTADGIITSFIPKVGPEPRNQFGDPVKAYEEVYQTADRHSFKDRALAEAHQATLKISNDYRTTRDETKKQTMRTEMTAAVTKEFELLRTSRLAKIEQLTKELDEAKAAMAKRDEVKDLIIEKRVEQLLGVDELYQWDSAASPLNQSGYYSQVPGVDGLYKMENVRPQSNGFNDLPVNPNSYPPFNSTEKAPAFPITPQPGR
jgi:hypothetical protein